MQNLQSDSAPLDSEPVDKPGLEVYSSYVKFSVSIRREEPHMLTVRDLYDLSHSLAGDYLSGFDYPWQALKGIKDLIEALGPQLGEAYTEISPRSTPLRSPAPWRRRSSCS